MVYPNGEHTNSECYQQKEIQATKNITPYALISAVAKLCQDIASQKQQTKTLKKQGQDLHKQKSGSKNTSKSDQASRKSKSSSPSHYEPAKSSKRAVDDASTAEASQRSSKHSKKSKKDTPKTSTANTAVHSSSFADIDDDDDEVSLDQILNDPQYISALDYAIMSSSHQDTRYSYLVASALCMRLKAQYSAS